MLWWALRQARSSDTATRLAAIATLGKTDDARATPILEAALSDRSDAIRQAAALALGRRRDVRALPVLASLFVGSQRTRAPVEALEMLRAMAAPLAALVASAPSRTAEDAANALVETREVDAAAAPLVAALGRPEAEVRAAALAALKRLGDARCIEPVLCAAEDPHWMVRREAVRTLGALRERGLDVPSAALARRLSDPDQDVRAEAAKLLRGIGWVPGEPADHARLALADADWDAVEALGSAAVIPLTEALGGRGTFDVARVLERIGDPAALAALVRVVEDIHEEESTRKAAARAAHALGLDRLEPAQRASVESVLSVETADERQEREIRELVGQAIDVPRGWTGLPRGKRPDACRDSDFVALAPGTYVGSRLVEFSGQLWLYLRQGSVEYLVDAKDVWFSRLR